MESDFYILFVDIIGSTQLSMKIGDKVFSYKLKSYGKHLSNSFKLLTIPKYQSINGDEGILIISNDHNNSKRILQCAIECKKTIQVFLKEFELAIGIHFGRIEYDIDEYGTIKKVYGKSLHFAKRIETESRKGKYSKIFISKEVLRKLECDTGPYINKYFSEHKASHLKGFEDKHISLFELKQYKIRREDKEEDALVDLRRYIPGKIVNAYNSILSMINYK